MSLDGRLWGVMGWFLGVVLGGGLGWVGLSFCWGGITFV